MRRLVPHLLAAALLIALSVAPIVAAPNCEGLAGLTLANTAITTAKSLAGSFTPPEGGRGNRTIDNLPAFCQVHGLLKPTPTSQIHFEVWLSADNWNGKLQVVGNGGLAGTISYPAMAALRNGFAAASTDTGHTAAEPAVWLQDRERLIDYSYRGLHLTTVDAKAIVNAYYSQQPKG